MKYQVVIESPHEAIVKTTYLNKNFSYVFLAITFDPEKSKHTIASGPGEYTFTSVGLLPPLPVGDPKRYTVIRQEYHRQNDINVVIKAKSLQEACDKFAEPYADIFEIVGGGK
jgi:hypothetical protein